MEYSEDDDPGCELLSNFVVLWLITTGCEDIPRDDRLWIAFKFCSFVIDNNELTVPKEFVPETKTTLNAPNGLFGKYPEINTLAFKRMKVTELREFTLEFYRLFLKGKKKEIEKHLKEVVFTSEGGRKIAYGEAMYSAKAAVIEHLDTLIKNSTYNNWGDRKLQDNEDILGYLNFKSNYYRRQKTTRTYCYQCR